MDAAGGAGEACCPPPPDALSCGPIEGSYCEVASCAGGDRVRDPGRQVRKESMRYPFRINEILYFV